MITFVEYDIDGNLVHIAEVYTAEGAVPPPDLNATPEERAERKAQIDKLIADREDETRVALANAVSKHAGIHVLPPNAEKPTHDGHKFDKNTGKVRGRNQAEKKAWKDKFDPPANANAGGNPTP